jgi:hypothetical protein
MRSILALAATMAVLIGGGVALASPASSSKSQTGKAGTAPAAKAPAAKTPKSKSAPHRCHNNGLSSNTGTDL